MAGRKINVKQLNTPHRVVVLKHDYVANRYDVYFVPTTPAVAPF